MENGWTFFGIQNKGCQIRSPRVGSNFIICYSGLTLFKIVEFVFMFVLELST
jgi:hypothetical protein